MMKILCSILVDDEYNIMLSVTKRSEMEPIIVVYLDMNFRRELISVRLKIKKFHTNKNETNIIVNKINSSLIGKKFFICYG